MLGKDKELDALLPLQHCLKHLFYMFLGELHRERTLITKELKVMDATSTTLCKDNNIPIIVFSMDIPGNITKAAKGEEIGTIVRGE